MSSAGSRMNIPFSPPKSQLLTAALMDDQTPTFVLTNPDPSNEYLSSINYQDFMDNRPFDNFVIEVVVTNHLATKDWNEPLIILVAVQFHHVDEQAFFGTQRGDNCNPMVFNAAVYGFRPTSKTLYRHYINFTYSVEEDDPALTFRPTTGYAKVIPDPDAPDEWITEISDDTDDSLNLALEGIDPADTDSHQAIMGCMLGLYSSLSQPQHELVTVKAPKLPPKAKKIKGQKFQKNNDFIIISPLKSIAIADTNDDVLTRHHKSPIGHARRGHFRQYKTGKTVWVNASKVKGGGSGKTYITK